MSATKNTFSGLLVIWFFVLVVIACLTVIFSGCAAMRGLYQSDHSPALNWEHETK